MASEDLSFGNVPNGFEAMPAGPRVGMGSSEVKGRWVAWQSSGAPTLWPRLCEAMQRPELCTDERFAEADARRENWPQAKGLVSDWLASFEDADAALSAWMEARVPCALVRTVEEVVACEHLEFRQAFAPVSHRDAGDVKVTSSPYWIDGAPVSPTHPAPYDVGEHTRSVLRETLGYSDAKVDELAAAGAIEVPGATS